MSSFDERRDRKQRTGMIRTVLSRRPVSSYVGVTFLFSWGAWILAAFVFSSDIARGVAAIVGSFGPAVAGGIMVVALGGTLRAWISEMVRWRIPRRWFGIALGLPLVFAVVEAITYVLFVGSVDLTTLPIRSVLWASSFLSALLVFGGNEELGWRGFMQPRLQRSYSAFSAALVVGVVWTVWHFPLDVLLVAADLSDAGWLLTRAYTVPLAVVYAWLYNSTGGSVLVAMLLHAGWNSASVLVPAPLSAMAAERQASLALTIEPKLALTRLVAVLVLVFVLVALYGRETLSAGAAHAQRQLP